MSRKNLKLTGLYTSALERLSGCGFTMKQMSDCFGCSIDTLERRIKENDSLKVAVMQGRAQANCTDAETGYQIAISGKSPAMTIFLAKNTTRVERATGWNRMRCRAVQNGLFSDIRSGWQSDSESVDDDA